MIAAALAMPGSAATAERCRPIAPLVTFAAGGAANTVARVTAQSMPKRLGLTLIARNATGTGGTIATVPPS